MATIDYNFDIGLDSYLASARSVIANPIESIIGQIKLDSEPIKSNSSISRYYDDEMLDYLLEDIMKQKADEADKKLKKEIEDKKRRVIKNFINSIDDVIFNEVATIVKFKNGEKVVVKCQPGEEFDPEKGLALALVKYLFGNISYYNEIFKVFLED